MRLCSMCRTELPYNEAWSDWCKSCKAKINRLSKVKRINEFV